MKKIVFCFFALFIIISCSTPRKTTTTLQNSIYKHDANIIRPQFVLFHVSDTISELHFKIHNKEILYMRPDGINFYSNILISYRLSTSYDDSKDIVDSASVRLVDANNDNSDKYLIGKINIKAKSAHTYYLHVTVADQNRNTSVSNVMIVEKNSDLNNQNFLVKSTTTDAPLFRNYLKTKEEVAIQYKAKIAVNLYVRYYNRDFPLAAPPFSTNDPKPFQYKQDSLFTVQLSSDGSVNFSPTKKGFYHFQLDTSKRDGVTLFYYSDVFPEIKKAEDLITPLRYITTKQEYDELNKSINKKAAIEAFWTASAGSQERSREIIRKYYNRVQDANIFFSSYQEGWKTDRGMVYLIYGAPNVVYRTANAETWIYGEENNVNSLSYSFSKVINPFTTNDFRLERSVVYKQAWYTAVDIWRQGRTYLQD
jgi:GWxTD domain-containing protein